MTRRTKNCAGYSMVELLTVLAVLTGILAMALPSMADFLAAMRLRSGADAMLTSLNFARSSAVQRSVRMALCRSTNGSSCSDSEDWNAGWLVFQDTNNSGTLDEGEALIYR